MRFLNLLAVLVCCLSWSAQAKTVRHIFKGSGYALQVGDHRAAPMTFGLTPSQGQQIRDLTNGQVDFSSLYSLEVDDESPQLFTRLPGYLETHHLDVPPPVEVSSVVADPEFAGQWWVTKLRVPEAWTHASGHGVTIADCDAGYYYKESDLNANTLVDLRFDFGNPDDNLNVEDGGYTFHGTAVAAIMVGVRDGVGTNGIAYGAKLVPFQNYNYDGSDKIDKEEATAKCILQAIQTPGVNIIVLENQTQNGSSETFIGTRDAVRLALQSGLIVVSAAGNAQAELVEEAKDDTGSIIVGAVDPAGSAENFSNYGARATVGAFGEQLHTLYGPNGAFASFGGTSGATPQVAAAVALMKEVSPFLTPSQARDVLLTTRVVDSSNSSVGGVLDVEKAVLAAKALTSDVSQWTNQQVFRARLNTILSH